MDTIYIGIGSNLNDPIQQVNMAIEELGQIDDTEMLRSSGLYRSAPLGSADQPDYINAVCALITRAEPIELLDNLQNIEHQHGRVRGGEQWGPRTLDLDILLFGDKIINFDRLIIPHSGLDQRSFVLYPLYEIAPDLDVPGLGLLQTLIAACDQAGLERINKA